MTDSILEKIKKLLRMRRGGSADEVAEALRLAQKLAAKHGIDLGKVNPDEESASPITHVDEVMKSRMHLEVRLALSICINFFSVSVVVTKVTAWGRIENYKIAFIGTPGNIAIAQYIFGFLVGHFRASWNRRDKRRVRNREAFLRGMHHGLIVKLDAEKRSFATDHPSGLVALNRDLQLRQAYESATFTNTKELPLPEDKSEAHASRYAGVRAGMATNIRPAVTAPPEPTLQLNAP